MQENPDVVTLRSALEAQRMKDQRKEHADDLRLELARIVMAARVAGPVPVPLLTEGELVE